MKVNTTKVNKTMGLLQKSFPRPILMILYRAFVKPHLDYGDVIYDEGYNETFTWNLNLQHMHKQTVPPVLI